MSNDVRDFNNLLHGLQQAAENGNEALYEQKRAALQRMLTPLHHLAQNPKLEIVAPEVLSWDDWLFYSETVESGALGYCFVVPTSATHSFCFVEKGDMKQMLDAKGAANLYKDALKLADA